MEQDIYFKKDIYGHLLAVFIISLFTDATLWREKTILEVSSLYSLLKKESIGILTNFRNTKTSWKTLFVFEDFDW